MTLPSPSRRTILQKALLLALARGLGNAAIAPARALTKGPKYHWFGYYDKLQFDPTSRYVLGMEVGFQHRSPTPDDEIRIGVIDTAKGDRWLDIGSSRAWNWQQGCMLQWLPGSKSEVVWNDRQDGRFISVVCDIHSGKRRVLEAPIYALSPDGKLAIYPDFRRLNDCRPGYGYAGLPDPNRDVPIPDDAGIWRLDTQSGQTKLVIPFSEAARVPFPGGYSKGAKHWFNHLLFNQVSSRFIFLHRWRGEKEGTGFSTRMFTADGDGKNLFVLDPYGKTSHFIWRDPKHVLAWAWHPSHQNAFYLYEDRSEAVKVIGKNVLTENGHCTYLPGNRIILNDTYPDKERNQHVYLYDIGTGQKRPLGTFHSPMEYSGEWRCDTHPRFSPDGRKVVIDSPHGGNGRQMYLLDLDPVLDRPPG